jgi:hypothetical protein
MSFSTPELRAIAKKAYGAARACQREGWTEFFLFIEESIDEVIRYRKEEWKEYENYRRSMHKVGCSADTFELWLFERGQR